MRIIHLTVPAHTMPAAIRSLYRKRGSWTPDFPGGVREFLQLRFSDMGLSLNVSEYGDVAEDLLFNHSLPTSLGNVNASSFALTEQTSPAEIMQLPSDRELR